MNEKMRIEFCFSKFSDYTTTESFRWFCRQKLSAKKLKYQMHKFEMCWSFLTNMLGICRVALKHTSVQSEITALPTWE